MPDNLDSLLGESNDAGEDSTDSDDAASDILEAIEDSDATALSLALKRFVEGCAMKSKKGEDKEEGY